MSKTSFPVLWLDAERIHLAQWMRAGSTRTEGARGRTGAVRQSDDQRTGDSRESAALRRRRVGSQGIGCMGEIAAGRSRKRTYAVARVGHWIEATLPPKPAGATHWRTRTLARAPGIRKNTIQRAWQDDWLQPHLTKSFTLSRDPKFFGKTHRPSPRLADAAAKRSRAVFRCEKSDSGADRLQPGLPLKPGRCGTDTLGYDRHGSTARFAVMQIAAGRVIGQGYPGHRPQDFLKFHQRLDAGFPSGKDLP